MPQVKPDVETFARIKVIGVGGSGLNAVDHMIRSKVKGVDFIGINTDAQDLHNSLMSQKLHIGSSITRGLGTGMDPELGRQAAEENRVEIQEFLEGVDMIFITCGFGGGTGTGAAPVIASLAKDAGILTIAVVTRPFSFEGVQRAKIAEEGIFRAREQVDAMIIIPNDRLLSLVDKNTPFLSAFAMCDEILRQAVQGISDIITLPGIVNVDFSDVRAVMENAGSALIGVGRASGERRAENAARSAINSPLLDLSINGAKGVLFSVAGGDDMTMLEIQEAAQVITESIDKDAKVIFGAFRDENLKKNEIKITVIASGFPHEGRMQGLFQNEGRRSAKPSPEGEGVEEADWDSVPAFLRRTKRDKDKT
ncbi:cell division protein FtsZ [Patescibacteria group bacterium]|nr:cell division protein FtsZ [Patescibacteria group bacterium]